MKDERFLDTPNDLKKSSPFSFVSNNRIPHERTVSGSGVAYGPDTLERVRAVYVCHYGALALQYLCASRLHRHGMVRVRCTCARWCCVVVRVLVRSFVCSLCVSSRSNDCSKQKYVCCIVSLPINKENVRWECSMQKCSSTVCRVDFLLCHRLFSLCHSFRFHSKWSFFLTKMKNTFCHKCFDWTL